MTVYHGSNVEVHEPKILKPNREVDFGNGFYTTSGDRRCMMCDRRHSALLTVIVPMVIAEIVRAYGIDEKTATERFYASRVYEELSEEGRKLWHYSPKVLFSLYDEETRTGSFTYPEEAF